jgi:hypothetical protein
VCVSYCSDSWKPGVEQNEKTFEELRLVRLEDVASVSVAAVLPHRMLWLCRGRPPPVGRTLERVRGYCHTNVRRSGQPFAHPPHYSLHGKRAAVCREARRCREARCVRRCAEKRGCVQRSGAVCREVLGTRKRRRRSAGGVQGVREEEQQGCACPLPLPDASADVLAASMLLVTSGVVGFLQTRYNALYHMRLLMA